MSDTLQGFFASDFGKISNPPITIQFGERDLGSGTTRTIQQFSMPTNKSAVEIWKSYVADNSGDPVSGLSLLVRDEANNAVIFSESSAQMNEGIESSSPVASGSAGGKVSVQAKNESGSSLTTPNGLVALRLV